MNYYDWTLSFNNDLSIGIKMDLMSYIILS